MKKYRVTVTLTSIIEADSPGDAQDCLFDLLSSDYAFDSDQVLSVDASDWTATTL